MPATGDRQSTNGLAQLRMGKYPNKELPQGNSGAEKEGDQRCPPPRAKEGHSKLEGWIITIALAIFPDDPGPILTPLPGHLTTGAS
jgi:hypothetical protein